ncbi:hypothetical protein [uncultured Ruthenibacterium sp.]|uniref:hypothetical protein n=1 Tax=uncultured Ruthenibacterium sp. TaxID=1905347 RepID=UPI00349EA75B
MNNSALSFRAKNGQIEIGYDGRIHIGRKGWFGLIYQSVMRSPTDFYAQEVKNVRFKNPALMRGYVSFETEKGNSTVWLTNPEMAKNAQRAKSMVEEMRQSAEVLSE